MRQPEVSVIIPTYESASYLPEALRSVSDQTLDQRAIDIIVVDDGSTDDVAGAIAPFGSRVGLIRIEHSGVSAARNAGIAASRGRNVAFLDADDLWLPQRLEALLCLARVERNALLSTDLYQDIAGRRSVLGAYEERGLLELFRASAHEQYLAALTSNFMSYMQLVPRGLFSLVGLFDITLAFGEDYDLWLRFLKASVPVRVVPKPLAIYRVARPGAVTASPSVRKAADRLRILQRRRSDVPEWRWLEATGYLSHVQLRHALRDGHYGTAVRSAWDLAHNPHYLRQWVAARRWRASAARAPVE
jgi:glycosyltransferase involved in cell wall biosynthesis